MSRKSTPSFQCKPLAALASQLLISTEARRHDCLLRAEALHDQLDPDAAYPFDYLAFRLTGFRRDYGEDALLVGQAIRPDLRQLIDQLSHSLELPTTDGDAVTADELAMRLNVSTKTLSRWRKAGLRWRWVVPIAGARPVIGFTRQAVERFEQDNASRVTKAMVYSQLTGKDRQLLVERARRLAAASDATFNQVATHLAKRSGRATETIRLVLEKHDRDHPDDPIFAERAGPLTPRQKRLISRAYRMGIGVGRLSQRFRRSRATIYRVVLDRRAAVAQRLVLTCVPHSNFTHPDAGEVYLRPGLEARVDDAPRSAVPLDGLPEPLHRLYVQPVISPDKVRSLFLRFNYLKHRAIRTRERFATGPVRAADVSLFERDVARAARIRSFLVTWHLPVVLSVARRHLVGKPINTTSQLVNLLERGNPVLIEAVDRYDAASSPTFESVLTNRLLRDFAAADGNASARRRVPGGQVVQRMIDLANESGVHLAITEDQTDAGESPTSDAN